MQHQHQYQQQQQQQKQQLHSNNIAPAQPIQNAGNHMVNANYQTQQMYAQQQLQQQNFSNIRSSVVQASVNPSGDQLMKAKSIQQTSSAQGTPYYNQYENYARPLSQNAPIYNNNNVNANNNANHNNNIARGYNNAHAPPQHSGQSYSGHVVPGNNVNPAAYKTQSYHNHLLSSDATHLNSSATGNNQIGKIADYNPLTDGPRNMPDPMRSSQTLIFSSDRGMSK